MAAQTSNAMAHNMIPDPSMLSENRICPGCKLSVVTENGGVVVAFGCVVSPLAMSSNVTHAHVSTQSIVLPH